MNYLETIIKELIKSKIKTQDDLATIKRKMAKKWKIPCPSNIALLKTYHELIKKGKIKKSLFIESLLKTRPIRSLSGIVNISVLTKPYPCPGRCLYCPQELGIPKSYVSGEPAVERAKRLNYDPYLQVEKRIEMLELEGHPTDKIELRTIGGTWSFYPKKYRDWFVKRCLAACNQAESKNQKPSFRRKRGGRRGRSPLRPSKIKNITIEEEQKINERAKHRIVGLSIETRPDFITQKEIKHLRELGVTMVELGVQSIYDDVLKLNLRGHGVKETILATKLLKDAGFKVLYQMMPNLSGSNLKKDEKMFKELFSNSDFRPDLLKIYPCALLKEAPLYKWWQKGKYNPYTEEALLNLIKSIKRDVPYYVRIQRITRDIPSKSVVAGPAKISNLRQILLEKMKQENWQCKCIRCREVRENYAPKEKIYIFQEDYDASGGKEIFLSFENKNRTKLFSLLRLRISSENVAIIREIHTYGQLRPIERGLTSLICPSDSEGKRRKSIFFASPQHKGLGKKLIKTAEKITKKEFGLNKIAVISAVGVRDYFRKLGYRLKDTYMVRNL